MKTETGRIRESSPARTMRCMECEEHFRFDNEHMYIGKTAISVVCAECGQRHTVLITGGGVQEETNL